MVQHGESVDPELRGHDLFDLLQLADQMYFTFRPRPDQRDRYDEQTSFYESRHRGVTFLLGGNGAGTTTLSLAKMVKFLLHDQEAPRPATPFLIISESYEMVCDVCWKEKLWGNGLLPHTEIDWENIRWYKPKQAWPFSVPLKPWPGGNPNNYWELQFKSYKQGRSQLQASSIGGFLFVEQSPYEILQEVNRGARVYNYPGSKLVEFTPVDPIKSLRLEEMISNNTLPPGWAVYRCNTQCAMEAGHVDAAWYEEFFASVPEEMRDVRQIGAFASYEGLIYQSFNPAVHVRQNVKLPVGALYHRTVDWGAGPEHPFVCLFAYKDAIGTWVVFDEYYSTDQRMTITDHAEAIMSMYEWPAHDPCYRTTYADPENALAMREFAKSGIPCVGSRKDVLEGINAVRTALKQRSNGMGPGLIIDGARCPKTVMEFRTYRWRKKPTSSANPADAAPQPLKTNDHCMDALRYLIYSDRVGQSEVLSKRIVPRNRKYLPADRK